MASTEHPDWNEWGKPDSTVTGNQLDPVTGAVSNGASSRRGRLWGVWLVLSIVLFGVAVGLFVHGGVALDHTTGHFGRIAVPGESYGLPDAGTYVISDGNYAAGIHDTPDFVVTVPDGESVAVETVPSHHYGHEDNALALFHVPRAGRHRLEVNVDGKDLDRLPSTVTVDRSWDGTGDPLTGAWASLAVGGLLLLLSFGFGTACIVALVRRFRTDDASTLRYPLAPRGHPPHGSGTAVEEGMTVAADQNNAHARAVRRAYVAYLIATSALIYAVGFITSALGVLVMAVALAGIATYAIARPDRANHVGTEVFRWREVRVAALACLPALFVPSELTSPMASTVFFVMFAVPTYVAVLGWHLWFGRQSLREVPGPKLMPGGQVAPLPGWYRDPADSRFDRWWDGWHWTPHFQPAPVVDRDDSAMTSSGAALGARKMDDLH